MSDSLEVVHRTALHRAWWLFGAGIAFAAWFGQPLLTTPTLQHQFYGMFWYSMVGLATVFWIFPAEQRARTGVIERRYCLLGLLPLWRQTHDPARFSGICVELGRNTVGSDMLWIMLTPKTGEPFAFAQIRANSHGAARAERLTNRLAEITGLPIVEAPVEAA